jgi:ferric enterobactin receptor
MQKILISTLLLFGFLTQLSAQRPEGGAPSGGFSNQASITGKIAGILIDSVTKKPVEFATVVVFEPKTNKQIDGTITDETGEFKFSEIKLGTYDLQISFLGYSSKTVKDITITPQKPDINLNNVALSAEGVLLNEVTVTGQAAVVENQIDKLVYNADKDVTSLGGDASNVLQKVPLLSVDAEGNVSLRGSSNVQILINGKPSTMFSSNAADALKTIPADQIKTVEVITSPTAKYDGEGSGGIINIITKKKSLEGFTGSVNGSVGNRQNRGSLNLNLTRGRFGMNFNGSGWYAPNRPSYSEYLRIDQVGNGEERVLEQYGKGDSKNYGPRVNLGMFYDLNAYNNISTSFGLRGFGRSGENLTDATFTDPSIDLNQIYTRNSTSKGLNSGFDWNTDYKRTFKKPGQELTIGYQLDMDFSDSENNFDQSGNEESLRIRNLNENLGVNREMTAQLDYVHPLSKSIKLEAGGKGILRHIESDFSSSNFDFANQQFVENVSASDIFYYDQDVYAGYLSFNVKLGEKTGLVVGSRYEHTSIAGDYDFNETTFSNSYGNFLPSFILSRNLSQTSSVKFSYNQRIRRPGLRFVNPYVDQSDPRDLTVGNPLLLPEISNQVELNYSTFVKGIVLNTSVFYRVTNDNIENFLEVTNEGISRNTFRNIGQTESLGASLFTSINIKEKLTLRGSASVSTYSSQATIEGVDLSRTSVIWNGNLNGTLTLKKGFKIEAFGFYNSPRQSIQGSRASFSMFNFGMVKEFSKKFSMGLNVSQPFSRDMKFRNESEGPTFYLESLNAVATRSIGINFNYRFGKLDFRQPGERGERNNDVKKDEEGGGNGGGGGRNR